MKIIKKMLGVFDLERKVNSLDIQIEQIKVILECQRVANFIEVVEYHRGGNLVYEKPDPISLVDLQSRIEKLESGSRPN